MSLQVPTTQELNDNQISDWQAAFNGIIALLPKSFLRVLARTWAALRATQYKYTSFVFLQMYVTTATNNETTVLGRVIRPLTELGRLFGLGDPLPAVQAELEINVIVTNQTGILSTQSQLKGSTNGVIYLTVGDVALDAPNKLVPVIASSDEAGGDGSGAVGNLPDGAEMTFVNPLPNVSQVALVTQTLVPGIDGESVENYRERIVERVQVVPQGGAYVDYRIWAVGVEGIVNAYIYTSVNPGEVDIYSEAISDATNPDGIPTAGQLQDVLDAINLDENGLATRRPATAFPNSFAITRSAFNVVVQDLDNVANLTQVQSDISAALQAYFLEVEPFIEGLSILPSMSTITNTQITSIVNEVVANASGTFSGVTFEKASGGGIVLSYELLAGEKAKLGTLTYTP